MQSSMSAANLHPTVWKSPTDIAASSKLCGHLAHTSQAGSCLAQYVYPKTCVFKGTHVDRPPSVGQAEAPFQGNCVEYEAANRDQCNGKAVSLEVMLRNKVKKCPQCNKPNAFVLPTCNACGADLRKLAISFTDNIFMCFTFGIQKGPFPYKISLRKEDQQYLVFDDILALTACHLNAIPRRQYIPDWRFLLKDPKMGLRIVNDLFEAEWEVASGQFLANPAWRKKYIKGDDAVADLRTHAVLSGFNYPPSQYQLHLQFFLLPWTPFHFMQFLKGIHMTHERFFPLPYVRKVLESGIVFPWTGGSDGPEIQDVIAFYDDKGICYNEYWAEMYNAGLTAHLRFSNWKVEDFDALILDGKMVPLAQPEAPLVDNLEQITVKDKEVLQNYGRPYAADGRFTGVYCSAAAKVSEVDQHWVEEGCASATTAAAAQAIVTATATAAAPATASAL